ncbi:oxidation resistance protein 1 [Linnemannia gamsii]|uniref:Oxidation resistance protein 1 n=1 Tax=Linnemannia gamsii TaxID=64522 RepID=A0ABQ7JTM0_9FUNG|nr:oxidation resistance protein 1 [Linnemannia gamsii]
MIPSKEKQAVLSLVTTEQTKYGPSRSTQSIVHGGDWGETTFAAAGGQYQQQGVEPNSAGSGHDPWMMVTGSGSSYVNNANTNSAGLSSSSGLPSSIGTPLTVREDQLNRMPPLQLLERNADTDPVLDAETAHQIRLELPRKLRNATKWNLVYSSDQHGISMTTLFHRCKGKGPMVLALKDTTDAVFGAFVTEELKPNLTYYGTGECFLWNVTTMITSPQPASPSFSPYPMPSPSPFQLSSSVTTPVGRSPSPSPLSASSATSQTTGDGNNSNVNGGDRQHDLFLAMNDRISTAGRSPSPFSGSPHQSHLAGSPSNSPVIRPSDANSTSSPARPPTSGGRKKKKKVVQFWKWTGKNDYMILSEPAFIGLGGGDGKFGLWLHSDLERGHSARCATFDNEPLAAACKHPIRLMAGGAVGSLAPPAPSIRATREDTPSGRNSRSSSPKDDKEEFYCQTVEIWSMAL